MKRMAKLFYFFLSLALLSGSIDLYSSTQGDLPPTKIPILIVSCGQSPGANMIKVLVMRLDLPENPKSYEMNVLATADDLKKAKDAGIPFKSVIIVMGASLKGMGAAGISIDDEIDRTSALMAEARNQEITIIGAHIEGIKRRAQGADPGDNTDELSIDAVAPNSDLLLINKEGNEDGRFSIIAEEKNIPMIQVEKNLELLEKLKELFVK
jgi:hypothetical protein